MGWWLAHATFAASMRSPDSESPQPRGGPGEHAPGELVQRAALNAQVLQVQQRWHPVVVHGSDPRADDRHLQVEARKHVVGMHDK